MRDFFSIDGPFNKYGGMLADTMILSLMWILFSVPIVTIGASTTAMFYVSTRRIANREGYITSDFWYAFKANFKRATFTWIILLILFLILTFNLAMLFGLIPFEAAGFMDFILPGSIVFFLILVIISIWIFPTLARFDMAPFQAFKSCMYMSMRHFLTTFSCFVLLATAVILSLMIPIVAFIAPGLYALLSSYMIVRIFKKYRPEMDRDPVLELQELEQQRSEEKRRAQFSGNNTASENEIPDAEPETQNEISSDAEIQGHTPLSFLEHASNPDVIKEHEELAKQAPKAAPSEPKKSAVDSFWDDVEGN